MDDALGVQERYDEGEFRQIEALCLLGEFLVFPEETAELSALAVVHDEV